jgi:protein SCO1/2
MNDVRAFGALFLAVAVVASCSRDRTPATEGKRYELRGHVLDVRRDVGEIRISHDAIDGYMDAMTMSFAVRDRRLLDGRARGDLVRGTLVVTDSDAWLSALRKTGVAPVIEQADASNPAPPFTLLEPGQRVPDVTLTDQDGAPWRPVSLLGKAYALTFTYTRCPLSTFCPMVDRNFKSAQQTIDNRPSLRHRVRLVTVSVDPEYDTPAVLKAHARDTGADLATWTFVTGERTALETFGSAFGLTVMRGEAGAAGITHNLRTVLIAPDGTLVKIYNGSTWTPEELVAGLSAAASR